MLVITCSARRARATVSARRKAITRCNVAIQTELLHTQAAVQVSNSNKCLSLSLVPEGSRQNACVRSDQVDDPLSLLVELKEEVERLRRISECEREIDWCSYTPPSLRQTQRMDAPREADPLPSPRRAGGEDLRDSGQWKRVPAWGGRRIPSRPASPPQVPLHNGHEALEPEGQSNDEADEGPRTGLRRARQSAPCIMTASAEKKKGNCHRRLRAEGIRGPAMPTGPVLQGSLLPPWGPGERDC